MYVLDDLWKGKISPHERGYQKNGEYARLTHEGNEFLHAFLKELSPEGREAFEKYFDRNYECQYISEKDCFVRGVRIGAQFVLDVLGEYRSPMPQIDECV